jgi:hypothetical protein
MSRISSKTVRQIADAHAAGLLEGAVVERFKPGEDLHERGFAGAVGADERGFFFGADEPVGLEKQDARAKALAGILQREHWFYFRREDEEGGLAGVGAVPGLSL